MSGHWIKLHDTRIRCDAIGSQEPWDMAWCLANLFDVESLCYRPQFFERAEAFTSEQAFEASEDGEPIYVSPEFQQQLCHEHDTLWDDYQLDCEEGCLDPHDAAVLLGWLGY